MKRETVIVIDFGGQYNQLVARRVRECSVYCEIYSYKTPLEKIKEMNPKGIILTGGPNSCYEADSPTYSKELFELGVPVLGLCYGAQLMMHVLGGKVEKADVSEYGKTELLIDKKDSRIFKNVSDKTICWMSHTDYIEKAPEDFNIEPEYEGISYDLVVDGKVMYKNLEKIGKNYKWLERQSEKFGIKPEEALIITIDGNNNFFCQPLQNKN